MSIDDDIVPDNYSWHLSPFLAYAVITRLFYTFFVSILTRTSINLAIINILSFCSNAHLPFPKSCPLIPPHTTAPPFFFLSKAKQHSLSGKHSERMNEEEETMSILHLISKQSNPFSFLPKQAKLKRNENLKMTMKKNNKKKGLLTRN